MFLSLIARISYIFWAATIFMSYTRIRLIILKIGFWLGDVLSHYRLVSCILRKAELRQDATMMKNMEMMDLKTLLLPC